MSLFNKKPESIRLCFKRLSMILLCLVLVVCGVFFGGQSIPAQIENLYSEENDQVAGISNLMSAVLSNDIEGVKFYSKAGKELVNQQNSGGATALHLACREKNLPIAKILIENGADVNIADNEGWTPIMRASLAGDPAIISLLLEKNAEAISLNSIGESVIVQASLSDCAECLNLMFQKSNFIRFMEFELLKEQLKRAYEISQNHENQAIQTLLSGYLERAIKMFSLVEIDRTIKLKDKDIEEEIPSQFYNYRITPTPKSNYVSPSEYVANKKFKFMKDVPSVIQEIRKSDSAEQILLEKKKAEKKKIFKITKGAGGNVEQEATKKTFKLKEQSSSQPKISEVKVSDTKTSSPISYDNDKKAYKFSGNAKSQ